tara:strand:+ start:8011 stop:9975 length:1965 start_codon:yes stop_codon:yes gene_type:complete
MIIFILSILAIFISVHFILNKKKIKEGFTKRATSCGGWNCSIEGQICPQGAPGASGTSYVCKNKKWRATNTITYKKFMGGKDVTIIKCNDWKTVWPGSGTNAINACNVGLNNGNCNQSDWWVKKACNDAKKCVKKGNCALKIAADKEAAEAAQAANNKCKDKGGLITEPDCKKLAENKGFDVSNKAHYNNTGQARYGLWNGCQIAKDGKKIWYSKPGSTGKGGNSSWNPICKHHFDYGQGSINAAPPVAESNDKCSGRGGDLSQDECLQYAKSKLNEVTKKEQYDDTAQTKRDGLWNGCQISSQAPAQGKKPKIWFAAKDTTTPAKKYGSDATSKAICKNDIMGVTQTTAKTCNLKNCVAPINVDGSCEGIAGQRNNNPIQKIINGYKKFFKKCEYKCLRPGPTNQPNYVDTGLWDKDANGALKVKMYGTNSNYNKEIHGCRTKEDCSASCGKVEVEAKGKMKETYLYVDPKTKKTTWVDKQPTNYKGEIKMVWEPEGSAGFFTQNRVGQSIKAKIDGSTTYVNGKIIKKNTNGTFDIKFDNGVTKIGMKKSDFKGINELDSGKNARFHGSSNTDKPNKVNAADTTMANMFLDINNPHDTGKKDMSLEDYYNKQLTIKNSENRLGGSKTAYTNRYRPQNKYGNIRFFDSVWKLF